MIDGGIAMEKQTHYSIELDSKLSAQLWQVLTESFDVEILCRQHSEDGKNQHISIRINGTKPAGEQTK